MKFVQVITALALAVAFVAAGFAACLAPPVTHALAGAFVRADISPFSHDQLVEVADATREFSFGNHDLEQLYRTIYDIDRQYADKLSPSELAKLQGFPKLVALSGHGDLEQLQLAFEDVSQLYAYDEQTISHLDDCYKLLVNVRPGLIIAAVLAVAGLIAVGVRGGRKMLGAVLMGAGIAVVAALVALGVWALIDFNGFFTAFHQAFFAQQGNWTFPYDSLLICSLPEAFWMGMGVVWLVVALALSAASVLVGNRLRKE